jgi:putative restriction endonuclease
LRIDIHRLFDEGLITVRTDGRIKVSEKLAHTTYAGLEGRNVSLPSDTNLHPSEDALNFHRLKVFR